MSTSPSTSPPRTPNDPRPPITNAATPNSDDSSIIDDLSFDYIFDEDGNYIRCSKGGSFKSNHSSPPTPQDSVLPDRPPETKNPSPDSLNSPMGRVSLSRSESAYSVLSGGSNVVSASESKPHRPFQRVASGPVPSSTPSYLAPTIASSRARAMPRRVTLEESREHNEIQGISRSRQTLDSAPSNAYALQEEKENIMSEGDDKPLSATASRRHSPPLTSRSMPSSRISSTRISYSASGSSSLGSRPLTDVPVPQRGPSSRQILPGPNRPGRIMKSSSSLKYSASNLDRLGDVVEGSEHDAVQSENEQFPPLPTGGEDTELEDEPVEPASIPLPPSATALSHVAAMRQRKELNINVQAASALSQSGSTRPRRSASLSDASHHDDYQLQVHPAPHASSRPGTSLGLNNVEGTSGARRVPPEERERQELEARAEYKKYRRDLEEVERRDHEIQQTRESPSPTHAQSHHQRVAYGHRRRDSDTLRNLVGPTSATALGSPTVMEMQGRPSPTASSRPGQGRSSPPASTRGRVSPASRGRLSPPNAANSRGRLSPSTANRLGASREAGKHRRSPTAPEPPTTSGMISSNASRPNSRTWANNERDDDYDYNSAASSGEKDRERERERQLERERERRERKEQFQQPPQQLQSYGHFPPAQVSAPAPPPPIPAQLNRHIVVNKKAYARLDMIGKGGSSRVFRVLNHANELYAIKRVSLDKTDAETMSGYMNEIALLKRLEGNSRIIRLIDSEVKPGPGGSKGHLLLVMECGEVDFSRLLQEQMKEPLNMVWVSYYWQQMLQAVHVIHEEKIVHSDLKPANFVLVKGQLKLIDFGIANAIANDTTNIQRDHQIGTVNYMSPEAIELPDGMRHLKVGRSSDVWSLGCILYQMVYGHPPFQHLSVYHKMKAIPDMTHVIEFPEHAVPCIPVKSTGVGPPEPPRRLDHLKRRVRPHVIKGMKSCLCRNPKERATIPELLEQEWLGLGAETEPERPPVNELLGENETVINPYYMRQLLQYGMKMGEAHGGSMDSEALQKEAERLVAELRSVHKQSTTTHEA